MSQLVRLSERHMAMARLDATGCTVDEIMAQTGYSRGSITQIRSSPLYKLYVRKLREQITEKLTDDYSSRVLAETGKSLDVVSELRDNDNTPPAVRLAAASVHIDRTLPKVSRDAGARTGQYTHEELMLIASVMKESGFDVPDEIDVTPASAQLPPNGHGGSDVEPSQPLFTPKTYAELADQEEIA